MVWNVIAKAIAEEYVAEVVKRTSAGENLGDVLLDSLETLVTDTLPVLSFGTLNRRDTVPDRSQLTFTSKKDVTPSGQAESQSFWEVMMGGGGTETPSPAEEASSKKGVFDDTPFETTKDIMDSAGNLDAARELAERRGAEEGAALGAEVLLDAIRAYVAAQQELTATELGMYAGDAAYRLQARARRVKAEAVIEATPSMVIELVSELATLLKSL